MSELLIKPLSDPLQEVNLRMAVAAADNTMPALPGDGVGR
jgi:hypothetical protein